MSSRFELPSLDFAHIDAIPATVEIGEIGVMGEFSCESELSCDSVSSSCD